MLCAELQECVSGVCLVRFSVWIRVFLWWTCRTLASTACPTCTRWTTCSTRPRALWLASGRWPGLLWGPEGVSRPAPACRAVCVWVTRAAWPRTRCPRRLPCTCPCPSRTLCSTWRPTGRSTTPPRRCCCRPSRRTDTCRPSLTAASPAARICRRCVHRTAWCSPTLCTRTATATTSRATTRPTTPADSCRCRCRWSDALASHHRTQHSPVSGKVTFKSNALQHCVTP